MKKSVLFVCIENSCRSQMAEGFAKHLGKDILDAWSAGSNPSGQVNPNAALFMKEKKIDLAIKEYSQAILYDPNSLFLHQILANIFHQQGALEKSVTHCRKILALDPNNISAVHSVYYTHTSCRESRRGLNDRLLSSESEYYCNSKYY